MPICTAHATACASPCELRRRSLAASIGFTPAARALAPNNSRWSATSRRHPHALLPGPIDERGLRPPHVHLPPYVPCRRLFVYTSTTDQQCNPAGRWAQPARVVARRDYLQPASPARSPIRGPLAACYTYVVRATNSPRPTGAHGARTYDGVPRCSRQRPARRRAKSCMALAVLAAAGDEDAAVCRVARVCVALARRGRRGTMRRLRPRLDILCVGRERGRGRGRSGGVCVLVCWIKRTRRERDQTDG